MFYLIIIIKLYISIMWKNNILMDYFQNRHIEATHQGR